MLGLLLLAIIVLPLRTVPTLTYVAQAHRTTDGTIWVEVDPTYRPAPQRHWFSSGYQAGSPYRIRLFFRPDAPKEAERVVISGRLGSGAGGPEVPLPAEAYGPYLDQDRRMIYIAGYLDQVLTAEDVPLDVVVERGTKPISVHFELHRTRFTRIYHAVWETMMSV
jgi:hypothetical protein